MECLKQAEIMFRMKPYNLNFDINSVVVNRNKFWQINVGNSSLQSNNSQIKDEE